MRFSTIWEASVGTTVTVSDGQPEPANQNTLAWKAWRSHNFTGTISEKGGVSPNRWVRFEIVVNPDLTVWYTLEESRAHEFSASDLTGAALDAYSAELDEKIDAFAEKNLNMVDALLLYAKWQETRDIATLGLAGVQALTPEERAARFPFLTAELNANPGLTGTQAYNRFVTQTTDRIARVARFEARRSKIRRDLAAATTQAEKEAAINIDWTSV